MWVHGTFYSARRTGPAKQPDATQRPNREGKTRSAIHTRAKPSPHDYSVREKVESQDEERRPTGRIEV